jgi:hypothetical protein
MCYIDGQKNKYSVLNECNRMPKYNILHSDSTAYACQIRAQIKAHDSTLHSDHGV